MSNALRKLQNTDHGGSILFYRRISLILSMFNILRISLRRLVPNSKPNSVRHASNLFEPDYLAVSNLQKIFYNSTKNVFVKLSLRKSITFSFNLGNATKGSCISVHKFTNSRLRFYYFGIISAIFTSNCQFIRPGSQRKVKNK